MNWGKLGKSIIAIILVAFFAVSHSVETTYANTIGSISNPITDISQAHGVASSGRYYFDFGGGLFQADVDTSEGGGWILVLQYSHAGGTNPNLTTIPVNTDLPVTSTDPLGTDQSADATKWGHTGNAAFSQFGNITDTRWKASTSLHGRVMHFSTPVGIDYLKTGTGNMGGINTSFTALSGHTSNLPGGVKNYYSNQGDSALTNFPFWLWGTYHWGVKGNNSRWEVDDYPGNPNNDTLHQVWIKGEKDDSYPVITLLDNQTVNHFVGNTYTDAGATASDIVDGDITGSIVVNNSVDSNTIGEYTVTYDVTDSNGNAADTETRTVNVIDFATYRQTDNDLDGVIDSIDIDDDNDGILDAVESGVEPAAGSPYVKDPFSATEPGWFQVINTEGSGQLFVYNVELGGYAKIGDVSNEEYPNVNGLGFNPVDGFIYGIAHNDGRDRLKIDITRGDLIRIDRDGELFWVGTPSGNGWVANTGHYSGDIYYNTQDPNDPNNGTLWVRNGGGTNMAVIDTTDGSVLDTFSLTGTHASSSADIVNIDGTFITFHRTHTDGQGLITSTSWDATPYTPGSISTIPVTSVNLTGLDSTDSGASGSVYSSIDPITTEVSPYFSFNKSGSIYRADIAGGTITYIGPGMPTGNNDGGSSPLAALPSSNDFVDTDSDGIIDMRDLDTDNDGIGDLYEGGDARVIALDTNNNGTIDAGDVGGFEDMGFRNNSEAGNGLDDRVEQFMGKKRTGVFPEDSSVNSGQNIPDYRDLDSDGDGIPDMVESQPTNGYVGYDGGSSNGVHQVGFINSGMATQETFFNQVYSSEKTYTLSADLGTRYGSTASTYTMRIYAGSTIIAELVGQSGSNGEWIRADVTSAISDITLNNQVLSISIEKTSGTQLNFDNVSLIESGSQDTSILLLNDGFESNKLNNGAWVYNETPYWVFSGSGGTWNPTASHYSQPTLLPDTDEDGILDIFENSSSLFGTDGHTYFTNPYDHNDSDAIPDFLDGNSDKDRIYDADEKGGIILTLDYTDPDGFITDTGSILSTLKNSDGDATDVDYRSEFIASKYFGHNEFWCRSLGGNTSDADAFGGEAVYVQGGQGQGGTLTFGKVDQDLVVGEYYKVLYRLKVSDVTDTAENILLDVFNPDTGERIASKLISAADFRDADEYVNFELAYKQKDDTRYELRVFYDEVAQYDLYADQITVESAPDNLVQSYNAGEFSTAIGNYVRDLDADGNPTVALEVTPANQSGGGLQFGPPETELNTGTDYLVHFNLKVDKNTAITDQILIDAYNHTTGDRVYQYIKPTDFHAIQTYQTFEIAFTRLSPGYEFRVFYLPGSDFTLHSATTEVYELPNAVKYHSQSENMNTFTGEFVGDSDADLGGALMVPGTVTTGGTLQFGPYEANLVEGQSYTANFKLKVSDNTSTDEKIYIDVFNNTIEHYEYRLLSPSDFTNANEYQTFQVPFVKATNEYEFRIFTLDNLGVDLYADTMIVTQ